MGKAENIADLVLGLDLGPTSVGWALVNEKGGKLIDAGVRVFPEGVDRTQQGTELSKSEGRRVARGMRRQVRRRAFRKKQLRLILTELGLLPTNPVELQFLENLNPYELRTRAISEKLSLSEIGRILIHLNQRRGFLSNRKADRGKKAEDSKMLAEISDLAKQMEEQGHRTIGEHLAAQYDPAKPMNRLRGKHTRRDMFIQEFELIWKEQQKHYPELLTEVLCYGSEGKQSYPRKPFKGVGSLKKRLARFGLFGLMFFQRPMYWPASVVGYCELAPKEKRCPRADRITQKMRIYQEVNNLVIYAGGGEIKDLTEEQRQKTLDLLSQKKEVKFDDLRKKLGLLENESFNLENGKRTKLLGLETDALLGATSVFGKGWFKLSEELRDEVVRSLLDDEEDEFLAKAKKWGFSEDQAEALLSTELPDGYASYSRNTLQKLFPFVKAGQPLIARDGSPCAVRSAGFLPPWERKTKGAAFLGEPPQLTNPLVRQALHEVRKVVNAIIREYGKPIEIHVELAREVKGNGKQREARTLEMRLRERRRDKAAEEIRNAGFKATRETINLYLLWEEQSKTCLYSGNSISLRQLLGGEVAIDHILPYSRSLDDSMLNKVVCFRDENDRKGNHTPYEWLAQHFPDRFEKVLQRAYKLPLDTRKAKLDRILRKSCELEDFINRQLSDTAYTSIMVMDYLRSQLGVDVLGSKGELTARLRNDWGLNTVLREDDLNLKNREDHRHHAVDAIVIALTNRSRLQQLSRSRDAGKEIAAPWENFRNLVGQRVNNICVSHRARRKVAGALHEETIYGPVRQNDGRLVPGLYVYRKAVTALTPAMLEDIRDPAIKQIICEHLKPFGVIPGEKGKIPSEAWKTLPAMKSGVVIKKVRLTKKEQSVVSLRGEEQFVKPGNNHHVAIFERTDAKGKVKRETVWVSMLEAVRRQKSGQPIIQRTHPQFPEAKFLFSLSKGEMVLDEKPEVPRLLRFKTGASTQGQLYFVPHNDSRSQGKPVVYLAGTLRAKKVVITPLGQMRWAND